MRVLPILVMALVAGAAGDPRSPTDDQLDRVRSRISALEQRLERLRAESADVSREEEGLRAQLELAEARVRENELLVGDSRAEAEQLRSEISDIADELEVRQRVVASHLEMAALLGGPGPLQLLFDAARGGDLDDAVSTVAVLTAAQVRLLREYDELVVHHTERLSALSRIMDRAAEEARTLVERRRELEEVRARVEAKRRELERSQRTTGSALAELRQRERALTRLLDVLASRERFTGDDDIRRYKGALPWPVEGTVERTFGRHYLPKYATYTVCNGLRFDAPLGSAVTAVFPGVVAYAQHFKGYGNMVVIDHGGSVYTLAAGLSSIHVRLDQRVAMGTRLGLASPPAADGNLYFEIREGQEPQDPRRWLQLAEDR
jgi:septal ring factor EnvC (AmiA/AmiB activator)